MAAKIITIAQQKGGAGKTTLAAHLALAWAGSSRVAIIDIDPQASLAAWFRLRRERFGALAPGLEVAALGGWRVAKELERLAKRHDVVLIDTAPHAETEARIAVRAASLVLVPVQPSPMDVWATRQTLDLARQERVPTLLVLNRVPPRANLTEQMASALQALGAPIAATQIGNRVALASALAEGRGILEHAPSSRAAEEITALAREVMARSAHRDAA
ncbi:MAG TPA: ParA family partition ATPase [Stellaceae bacterium]|jgi:chromosome partitioning protein|nr:ParA family partition ATPase [Stellaceae bacterium]